MAQLRRATERGEYLWHAHENGKAYSLYPNDEQNYWCLECVHYKPDARVAKGSPLILRTKTRNPPKHRTVRHAVLDVATRIQF